MAITHEGTETAINNAASNPSSTLTVSKPAGAAEDDVAVAAIFADDVDATSLPTGFTEIATVTPDNASILVFGYKVLGASEPSSYDFSKDSNEDAAAAISVFRGVDTASPLDATSSTNTGDSASPTATSVTTSTNEAALVAIAGMERDSGSPYSPPSGMTELSDLATEGGTLAAGAVSFTHAWGIQSSAGASGDKQFTASDGDWWGAGLIALSPQVAEKFSDLGLASETSNAFSTTLGKILDVGLSHETSSSFTLEVSRSLEVGLATESNQTFGVSLEKTVDLGLTSESDQTFSVVLERLLDVGLASESDIAFGVTIDVTLVAELGLTTEDNSAFSVTLRKDVDLGLSTETDVAFSIEAGLAKVVLLGLSTETSTAFSMEFPKDVDLGVSSESTQAFSLVIDRSVLIGLASETNTAFSVFIDAVLSALLGLARESTRSFRLDSGLSPFRWAFYDQTTPGLLPSRRRFRPLILTDRVTDKTYVIKLGDGLLLELEEADKESQMDELFLPFQEPTMKVGEHTVRIYVENGDLKWEFYSHHVRNRPILFGKVLRPKPRQPRYILLLDEGVLDETDQDT